MGSLILEPHAFPCHILAREDVSSLQQVYIVVAHARTRPSLSATMGFSKRRPDVSRDIRIVRPGNSARRDIGINAIAVQHISSAISTYSKAKLGVSPGTKYVRLESGSRQQATGMGATAVVARRSAIAFSIAKVTVRASIQASKLSAFPVTFWPTSTLRLP